MNCALCLYALNRLLKNGIFYLENGIFYNAFRRKKYCVLSQFVGVFSNNIASIGIVIKERDFF